MKRGYSLSCDNLALRTYDTECHYLSIPSNLQYYLPKDGSLLPESDREFENGSWSKRPIQDRRHGFALTKNEKPRINIREFESTEEERNSRKTSSAPVHQVDTGSRKTSSAPVHQVDTDSPRQSSHRRRTVIKSVPEKGARRHVAIGPNLSWSPFSTNEERVLKPRLCSSQVRRSPKPLTRTRVTKWIESKREKRPMGVWLREENTSKGKSESEASVKEVNLTVEDDVFDLKRSPSRTKFLPRKQSTKSSRSRRRRSFKSGSLTSSSDSNEKKNVVDFNMKNESLASRTNESSEEFYKRRLGSLSDMLLSKGKPSLLITYLQDHKFTEALKQSALGMPKLGIDVCLLWASLNGNFQLVKMFLIQGGSPVARDADGFSALHLASFSGSAKTVEVIIKEGAPVTGPTSWDNKKEYTALMLAAKYGYSDIVSFLLQEGAEVDAGFHTESFTALHYAVRSGNVECVQLLVNAGATVNATHLYGETPLHSAVEEGLSEVVECLLRAGADVHVPRGQTRMTSLHISAQSSYYQISFQLLKAGADSNQQDFSGRTPLHLATKAQCFDTVQMLLSHNANPNAKDFEGKTPLHTGIFKGSRNFECLKLLLEANGDPNIPDNAGYTPLHLAALNDSSYCVKLFLKHGADLTKTTKGGITALNIVLRRTPTVITYIQEKLNSSISFFDHEQHLERDGQIQLDFGFLLSRGEDGSECRLLSAFIKEGQKTFLRHPLCQTFLFLKWIRVRSFFMFNLFFYMALVAALSQYFYMVFIDTPAYYREEGTKNRSDLLSMLESNISATNILRQIVLNLKFESECLMLPPHLGDVRNSLLYFIWFLLTILLLKEGFQVLDRPKSYFSSLDNIMVWPVIIGTLVLTVSLYHWQIVCPWQYHLAALVTLFNWFELLLLVGRFPTFGLYVHMFAQVTKNFGKFLFTYICLINAFSSSFGILFHNQPPFKHRLTRLLKTLVMMTGEIDYNEWFYENKPAERNLYVGTSHLIFALFLLFGTIILMNLLVGLAVSDIQGLQKSAGLDRLVRQTELIAHFETFMFSKWLKYLVPNKFLKLLHSRILLVHSSYDTRFLLNPKTYSTFSIPVVLIESIKRIARTRDHMAHREYAFADFRTLSNPAQLSGELEGDLSRCIDAIRSGLEILIWEMEDQHEEMTNLKDRLNSLTSLMKDISIQQQKGHRRVSEPESLLVP